VEEQLRSDGCLSAEQAALCLRLAEIRCADTSFVASVKDLGVSSSLLDEGIAELAAVLEATAALSTDRFSVEADLRVARGLDYYTGTVFETRMQDFEDLGSVCSGGRYDALASDAKATYPGVGISFGVTRVLVPLFQRGLLTGSRPVPSAVLVALVDEAGRAESDAIATRLRARGIATEVAASAAKYGKQIRYAERRGIPYVWFPGSGAAGDSVKDIRTGEQRPADAETWQLPESDLRPQVLHQQGG
jgi:histidyl-tRNA synthetase